MNILRIDSSGRFDGSATRKLADHLLLALEKRTGPLNVVSRDLASGVPHVDPEWIAANFTPVEERTPHQEETLGFSDMLVAELQAADAIVIGIPIYNFGVPAAMKAWVDMIARAGLTFRYTKEGPIGLLKGKKVYLVIASGGVGVDSVMDFATPYMRQALRFVGMTDVEVIAADQQQLRGDEAMSAARLQIEKIIHKLPLRAPANYAA